MRSLTRSGSNGSLFPHGGVPVLRRRRWWTGSRPVFLLPLKAGGTGLNLTRATRLIAEGTLEDQIAAPLENKRELPTP